MDSSLLETKSHQHPSSSKAMVGQPEAVLSQEKEYIYSTHAVDYELRQAIGFGSSAVVYLAYYIPLKEVLCIKQIDLDQFERNQIDELRKEIQVMSLCRHANVLPIKASFVHGSKLWIVMPFLAAGSCLDILKAEHPDGFEEIIIATILKQALQGLAYLHKNGQIHRDVKAGNLLMDHDGIVMLADFGVSSSLTDGGERKGMRKTFVGTPCWMAPEVMEQEKGYDSKADIWSFGITALELATGQAPFAKYPPMKVLLLTLQNPPPTLDRNSSKRKYSKSFKEMIDSCLQKDPAKRPSAEKLLQHTFFKEAKKSSYLVTALLEDLPALEERIRTRIRRSTEEQTRNGTLWDFSINSTPAVSVATFDQKFHDESNSGNVSDRESSKDDLTLPEDRVGGAFLDVKKSRFVVESASSTRPSSYCSDSESPHDSHDNIANLTSARSEEIEVKKGRFSVIGKKETGSNATSGPESEGTVGPAEEKKEEKRGRFHLSSVEGSEKSRPPSSLVEHRITLQELQEQISNLLRHSDQQRLLINDLLTKLDNHTYEQSISSSTMQQKLNSLKKENDDLKKDNERLKASFPKLSL